MVNKLKQLYNRYFNYSEGGIVPNEYSSIEDNIYQYNRRKKLEKNVELLVIVVKNSTDNNND